MSQIICDSCGKEIKSDFKLCPYCGQELVIQEPVSQLLMPPGKKGGGEQLQDYLWIISLLSGILTIISLMIPAAYATIETPFVRQKITSYLWTWGYVYTYKGLMIIKNKDYIQISTSLSMILLILGFISTLISHRFGNKKIKEADVRAMWVFSGGSEILIVILWMIITDNTFPGIWAIYTIGGGLIGLFISGILLILSATILKVPEQMKKEKKEIPYDKEKERRIAIIVLSIFIIFIIIVFSIIAAIFL